MRDIIPWILVVFVIFAVGVFSGSEDGYRPGEIDDYPPTVDNWDEEEDEDDD